jgi:hypothetical protein
MNDEEAPRVTSVTVTDRGSREPIIVSAEENALEISIRDALLAEPRLGGADLHIARHEDRIVISGTVETDDQRTLTLDIAARFIEGTRLTDHIQTQIPDQSPDFCEA